MTIGTLATALGEFAKLLDVLRASNEASAIRSVEAFLAANAQAKSAPFLRKATPTREVGSSWTGFRTGKLVPLLEAYNDILNRFASKTGQELTLLLGFLRQFEGADLDQLIVAAEEALIAVPPTKPKKSASASANTQLVADYVARLKRALGNDTDFNSVFEPLAADKAARKQEVAEIAKQMMPVPPSGIDRKKGLKAIRDLHLAAKGFDLKLKASSGRSAA